MRLSKHLSILALSLAACGGGGSSDDSSDNSTDSTDGVVLPDGPNNTGTDAPPSGACAFPSSFGAVTQNNPLAAADATPPVEFVGYLGNVGPEMTTPQIGISLYMGYGAFTTAPIAAGTYQFAGEDASYETCGVCGVIYQNADAPDPLYMATAGTVNVTSVSPNFTGTLSNVTMTHFDTDDQGATTPSADGCATTITSMAFDATVAVEMPKAGGAGLRNPIRLRLHPVAK